MKKLVIFFITVSLLAASSPGFSQDDASNPVKKGNLVFKLFDILGYAGMSSGDLYDDTAGKYSIFGINDTLTKMQYTGMFYFSPEINYFVIDGLAIGGSFHYSKQEINAIKTTLWSIGPSVYYYYNVNNTILPYAGLSYVYATASDDQDVVDQRFTRIPLSAGCAYMLGRNLSLYGQLSYTIDKFEDKKIPVNGEKDGKIIELKAGIKVFF